MKHLLKLFGFLTILLLSNICLGQTIARSVVAAAGETFTNGSTSLTYTVGETVAELLSNTQADKYLTAGFNQPDNDLKTILNQNISSSIVLFPNPTSGGSVKIAFNHVPNGIYTIDLIDASGRILKTLTFNYSSDGLLYVPMDVSELKGGIYFIKVVNKLNFQGEVKLIKI